MPAWPREYGGDWYETSEMFPVHASMRELRDPGAPRVCMTGAWFTEAPSMTTFETWVTQMTPAPPRS